MINRNSDDLQVVEESRTTPCLAARAAGQSCKSAPRKLFTLKKTNYLGSMTRFIQVLTTVDSEEKAKKIVSSLLESRAAACVQVLGPIDSSYWWKGRVERAREWICLAKGKTSDYRRMEKAIKLVHPYEVPEILATPVSKGNARYLQWISAETSSRHK
jgi:periplasmic divalent cation tolerance protein